MLTAMGLAAAVLGRRFRIYTLATVATFVAFGVLTSIEAPRLAAGLSTPYLGLWERINMGAGMLWIAVLAIALLHRLGSRPPNAAGLPRNAVTGITASMARAGDDGRCGDATGRKTAGPGPVAHPSAAS
jgi:hypothetical protein